MTETVRQTVLRRIAEGESLRQIAKDEGMPAPATVCDWAAAEPVFAEQYARAREAQMDRYAEEILEISDDATNDWMTNKHGDKTLDAEHVQRSRLRVDSRKWLMSKLAPKKYGERLELEHSGGIKHDISGEPQSPEQWASEHATS